MKRNGFGKYTNGARVSASGSLVTHISVLALALATGC